LCSIVFGSWKVVQSIQAALELEPRDSLIDGAGLTVQTLGGLSEDELADILGLEIDSDDLGASFRGKGESSGHSVDDVDLGGTLGQSESQGDLLNMGLVWTMWVS
jgi:hypothetical protein